MGVKAGETVRKQQGRCCICIESCTGISSSLGIFGKLNCANVHVHSLYCRTEGAFEETDVAHEATDTRRQKNVIKTRPDQDRSYAADSLHLHSPGGRGATVSEGFISVVLACTLSGPRRDTGFQSAATLHMTNTLKAVDVSEEFCHHLSRLIF